MHTARLLLDEPFFASLSRRVNKTSSTALPTAGVRVNPKTAQFEMIYNPEFFEKLDDAARKDVLKHEFYHLVFEHVTGRKPDGINPLTWNFATDLAINSHLENLPKGCLKPGLVGTQFEEFPSGLSADAYLGLLQKQEKEKKEEKTNIDWRNVLRYFIKTSTRANKRSTVKRLNKRYRYIHPGKKVQRRANIAISIDQSGSVSDEMLQAFFGELNKLAKLATFTVVPFDTRVDDSLVYEWKQGQNHKTERVMHGGTCFDAPTEYVNKNGFDGHIVLTDLMAPKPKASKCQRMWMTTKYYAERPYFKTNERILAIDV